MTFWPAVALTAAMTLQAAPTPAPGSAPQEQEQEQAAGDATPFGGRVTVHAQAALLADVLPVKDAAEWRSKVSISIDGSPTAWSRFRFDARAESLVADRGGRATDVAARVTEAWVEVANRRADVRAGVGRLPWGRLDEVSPADVVNPIDAARYLLEGRSEARLPVAFVRGRWFPSDGVTIEALAVPVFARGRFDELDEPGSPFNLLADIVLPAGVDVRSRTPVQAVPETVWRNMSGGGRLQATVGRVDVTGSFFRGFESFGPITFEPLSFAGPGGAVVGQLVEHHPRFTMAAADFETVIGNWVWRGEAAATIERTFAGRSAPGLVRGRSFDAGGGFDRRAGAYRVYGSLLVHRDVSQADPAIGRTDVTVIGSVDRQFARDRYLARAFGVVNPKAGSAFLRGVLLWRTTDRASIEVSGGTFLGTSDDRIGQFADRDFAFARFKYDF